MVGNVKESLLPYIGKQFKLAMLSFDLFGAISPTTDGAEQLDPVSEQQSDHATNESTGEQQTRSVSQAEVESSLVPVRNFSYRYR